MALADNGNGLSAADVAAVVGNNGGAFGNGGFGDGLLWYDSPERSAFQY